MPNFERSKAKVQRRDRTSIEPKYVMESIKPLTSAQDSYLKAFKSNTVIFGVGPAGTGKSFCAGGFAAEQLFNHKIRKVLVTRPVVEAGEKLGFLPGELQEKFAPYLYPLKEVFDRVLGFGQFEYLQKAGCIEACPIAYMRGRSLDNTIVLVDEAQNVSPSQMKMLLTRIGQGSKIIIDGDPTQKDIPGPSGLTDAISRLNGLDGVKVVTFDRSDVVRSDIVQAILERYES